MEKHPVLRDEVGALALRVRSDVRGHGQVRLCKALGCGRCGCLKPIRACCVVGSAFFLVVPPRGGCAMAPRDSSMCWEQFNYSALWRLLVAPRPHPLLLQHCLPHGRAALPHPFVPFLSPVGRPAASHVVATYQQFLLCPLRATELS